MTNILVLDGNQRSALAIVRSLGKLSLNLLSSDHSKKSLAGESKYVIKHIHSPSSKDEPDKFISWFCDVVKSEKIDLAMPVTEITSQLLLHYRKKLPPELKLPFADLSLIMQLADKSKLMKLAERLGVRYPVTRYYNHYKELDFDLINKFPLVLKPAQSRIFLGDKWLDTEVKICHVEIDLQNILDSEEEFLNYPFMLQEFIPGNGAGVFTIYNQGASLAFFAHKRLREKPPSGGVSVLCESADLEPEMLAFSRKILDSVNWHGVAMVEFRVSEQGTPYLMEVNTRFWGSLQLAVDAGVDFPAMLYAISLGEEILPVNDYVKGQQLRWFFGDLDSLYIVLKSRRYSIKEKLERIFEFIYPKIAMRRMEVNRFGDFSPAIFELKEYIKNIFH